MNKSGSQSGDKINWSIEINHGQSTLNDAKIVDTPSGNQQLLPELLPFVCYGDGDERKCHEGIRIDEGRRLYPSY